MNDGVMSIEELVKEAMVIRSQTIEIIANASKGHPGGSLSAADILTALYFRVMKIVPENPDLEERDRFILSKGHACPVLYAVLGERGFFPRSHYSTLRKLNSILQAHPDMKKTPGIDMSSGSLGQGLSVGLGMALAGRLQKKDYHVWVLLGDGELQEGAVWEAAMACSRWHVDTLTAIVDSNKLQCDDFIVNKMPIEPLKEKWQSFGWEVTEIDGHNMGEIVDALEASKSKNGFPKVIIANTVKGKGVSYMENRAEWHGGSLNAEQKRIALADIAKGLEK